VSGRHFVPAVLAPAADVPVPVVDRVVRREIHGAAAAADPLAAISGDLTSDRFGQSLRRKRETE
jgi:hypothetical protein